MIQIICKSESYTYNAYHILKAFYPSQEVSCKTDEKASNYVMVHLPDDREISVGFENTVEITDTAGRDESTGKIQEDSEKESQKKERKRQIDLSLYEKGDYTWRHIQVLPRFMIHLWIMCRMKNGRIIWKTD